ncbi:NADP-dependent oxidoreductase (plasmid) [Polymorphobacter sp. PAMC 29334]|uniref:NADP-dependent oxidoreductase n=1 Tax=Polymorphobacter sp. PAMC 29334 TaxID=2862331 RepID=UPI001C66F3E5|nr:NADP-dependent oxidoreductase [Polymorphobacter sp. PAMC 29334]QYE37131.1 NADP-dependent oxidoreductase [Polymorphobacter sp. PAMC 29334]
MSRSREIRFRSRPEGAPSAANFELAEVSLDAPADGEVQVRNLWMSVDPYMRGRMTERTSYVSGFELGKVLQGGAVGEVVVSNADGFVPGDLVQSMLGWREGFNAPAASLQKLPDLPLPPEAYLGVAGLPGLTAYVGMSNIAEVKPGDVVFVSAAAGAVGSVACQIAKIKGATVVGSAGGIEKCAFLRDIGVDQVIDYKAETDLTEALARVAPDGIDVCFENVGGVHLEAALANAKFFARFALCGNISNYNKQAEGPRNIEIAVTHSLRLQGFIVSNYFHLMPKFAREVSQWVAAGKMQWRQTVVDGLEQAPDAFGRLFTGEKLGKMLVKLA